MTPNASPSGKPKARIFLVDDHPLVRERLAQVIDREADLVVCGEAPDAPSALVAIATLAPDLAIVDISLKDSHGLELIKDLQAQRPALPILVLSMHDESLYAERVLRAGALGYITKQEATRQVLNAIRQVLSGRIYLSEQMAARMLRKTIVGRKTQVGHPVESLTDRELEVFQLIGRGYATRKIAEELHLGLKTVESYRARIKEKLALEDGTQLMQQAVQWVHRLGSK